MALRLRERSDGSARSTAYRWVFLPALALAAGALIGTSAPSLVGAGAAGATREDERALRIWIADDSTKILGGASLGEPWSSSAAARAVRLEGAGGETVAFQIVVESDRAQDAIEVRARDLTGAAGIIDADRFSIFLETYLQCPPVHETVVSMGPGRYPDPLVPLWEGGPERRPIAHPIEIGRGARRVLWVDLSVPRGIDAGTYRGALEIAPKEAERVVLPIELVRYDFELPAEQHLDAWVPLYTTRFMQRENLAALDGPAKREVLGGYFRMARRHRFVTQLIEVEPELRWNESTGELLSADWSAYDALYEEVLSGKLFEDGRPPPFWKVGGFVWWGAQPADRPHFGGSKRDPRLTPAHARALGEYAREIRWHFDEKGWTRSRLFMYMIDEPDLASFPQMDALIADYGTTLRKAGAGIEHLVTIRPGASRRTHGAVDIWAVGGAGYRPPEMQERQKLGERAWFHQKHEPFLGGHCVNHEGLGLRTWPWIAWRYGVDGIFLWVGNYWKEDPYRDPVNGNDELLGNGILFYPGALLPTIGFPAVRGPVGSFRMKALRRGLLDYEYFHLLRTLGGDPDPIVRRIVRSALNEEGWDPIGRHPLWARHGDWSHDPAEWDAARREVAREITRRLSGSGSAEIEEPGLGHR